jgi:hypothetical protein
LVDHVQGSVTISNSFAGAMSPLWNRDLRSRRAVAELGP